MKVKDIMTRDFVSLSPDETVSKLISVMEKNKIHQIPLIENKKLVGMIYEWNLTQKGIVNPSKEKIRAVMSFPPPTISSDQNIEEAAQMIMKTGIRALPVIDSGKISGIISIFDIIVSAAKTKEFRQTLVDSIMSVPETIDMNTDIGSARATIREKHYEKLPVVNSEGKLAGVVSIFDLAKAIKPRERMGWYSMGAEKERIMDIPASTIMDANPVTADRNMSLSEIANLMNETGTSSIVITQSNIPIGIITAKDLLEVYVSRLQPKGVYYQIIGLTDEDDFVVSTVDRMIKDTLQKISKTVTPTFFFVHVKRHDKGGEKIKYGIRARLRTERGTYISKSHAWDLRDAVNEALDRLERAIFNRKFEEREKFKKMKVRFKTESGE